jgi:hypothetical protein
VVAQGDHNPGVRTFLLFVVLVVVVAAGFRLARLRDDPHAGALTRAVAGETIYLSAMLGFVAYHADWLPWPRVIVAGGLTVFGVLLIRVALIASAAGEPRPAPGRTSPGRVAWYVAGLTLAVVLPVLLARPAPRPQSAVEVAAETFGGRIDNALSVADTPVIDQHRVPRAADAAVAGGEAVPVQQYRVDGRQVSLVVTHHLQCSPRAVVVARDGDTVAVAVVAAPAPNADALFGASPGPGAAQRCAPDGAFTWRTVVNVRLGATGQVSGLSDAGAHGPATRVS